MFDHNSFLNQDEYNGDGVVLGIRYIHLGNLLFSTAHLSKFYLFIGKPNLVHT